MSRPGQLQRATEEHPSPHTVPGVLGDLIAPVLSPRLLFLPQESDQIGLGNTEKGSYKRGCTPRHPLYGTTHDKKQRLVRTGERHDSFPMAQHKELEFAEAEQLGGR